MLKPGQKVDIPDALHSHVQDMQHGQTPIGLTVVTVPFEHDNLHAVQTHHFDIAAFHADDETFQSILQTMHDAPDGGDFKIYGPVWTLILTHDQTAHLEKALDSTSGALFAAAGAAGAPYVAAAIAGSIAYIHFVDWLGGNNGVEITGVIGTQGVIVTPRTHGGLFEELVRAGRIGVAVATVIEWVIAAVASSPNLASTMALTTIASVSNLVTSGTPLGLALATVLGLGVAEVLDDPNPRGAVTADRTVALEWETFTMAELGGGKVSLLSHVGLFSAQGGGGGPVYANRPAVGDWERWDLVRNPDDSVSFRSSNGHYLVAEGGGGSVCNGRKLSRPLRQVLASGSV